jgi:RNase P/RNase MRP subunit POP5
MRQILTSINAALFQELKPSQHFSVNVLKQSLRLDVISRHGINTRATSELGEACPLRINEDEPRGIVRAKRSDEPECRLRLPAARRSRDEQVNMVPVFR